MVNYSDNISVHKTLLTWNYVFILSFISIKVKHVATALISIAVVLELVVGKKQLPQDTGAVWYIGIPLDVHLLTNPNGKD